MFIIIVLLSMSFMWFTVRWAFKRYYLRHKICSKNWIYLIDILFLGAFLLRFYWRKNSDGADFLGLIAYLMLSLVTVLFSNIVLIELVLRLKKWWNKKSQSELRSPDLKRRQFLTHSFGFGTMAMVGSGYYAAHRPKVFETVLLDERLPAEWDGLRIVQLSDIHIGPTIKKDFMQQIVETTNQLNPDLCCITGDLVDGKVKDLASDVRPLEDLKTTWGTYYVNGNHEYYWGEAEWSAYLKTLGIKVLKNEHHVLTKAGKRLQVSGVTDYKAHRFNENERSDAFKARGDAPADYRILLAHQPRSCYQASKAGYQLQLCGHTHAGQYFPWNYFIYFFQPYVKGLNRHDNMYVYVNRGTGYWGPPNRLGQRGEISLMTLKSHKRV